MDDKAKQAKNEYHRLWRARNKDKVKELNARYWSRKAEKQQETKLGKT